MDIQAIRVRITGRVQGVGFRYATARQAHTLGIDGWVRNLPDGAVEACFRGPQEKLDAMLDWCRAGPPYASVQSVLLLDATDHQWQPGFFIR